MDFNSEMFDNMIDESGSDEESEQESVEENEPVNNKRKLKDETGSVKKVKYEDISENGKKSKKKNELFKQPTVEELNELKETENLFNNNLFRLQIKELISEVEIKNKRKKFIKTWFESFQALVESIKDYEEILLSNIKTVSKKKLNKEEKLIKKIVSKKQEDIKTDQDLQLKFLKPEAIETFGLYENQSLAGPNLCHNINLKMPKNCFHVKDFLNNRYLVKRYYYLLYICAEIESSDIIEDISIEYYNSNHLLPILKVTPKGCDKIVVRIFVSPSEDHFKPSRFLPEQNNVKQSLFNEEFENVDVLRNTGTLLYNWALAFDVTLTENNNFIKKTLNELPNIQEGIKLLTIWSKQRELDNGFGFLTDDIILYIIVYLTAKRKVNKHMSSYQVIRNFWSFLSSTDIYKNPISICESVPNAQLNSFKENFDIALLDVTGCFNILGFLNIDVYKKVKSECDLALKHLDNNKMNSFQSLFLTKLPHYQQYDLLLSIKELPSLNDIPIEDTEKAKYVGYNNLLVIKYVSDILKKGLNKRALHLVPKIKDLDSKSVTFYINLDPECAFNFIDHGPALNDHVEAEKFRKFWGHLSSDRRFRDGTTKVAVYFKTRTIRDKRSIIKKIVNFLLQEKLNLEYNLYFDEFEDLLVNKKIMASYPLGTNEEGCLKVITLSDELGKKIRELKISLSITGLQGTSDVYSYTEVFPPIATNYKLGEKLTSFEHNNLIFAEKKIQYIPRYVQPIECVMQLEHSSKWPNNLEAVKHIKTSFYIEISKLLNKNHKLLCHVTREYLDVFYQGLVFRYRLYLPKEIALLKKEANDNGIISYKDSLQTVKMNKNLIILPKVNSALKGLQSQYPSFGPGTALIKRWLRSQLIDDYLFPNIVINLLNASLYLNDTPFFMPHTPQMSFIRFLKFFSDLQWDLQTIVVNFNDEISKDDIAELEGRLQQNREAHQPLYIIMPFDNGESVFTKKSPTKEVLLRVRDLALATLNVYVDKIENGITEVKDLFIPNWEGYNLLIHLFPLTNPRRHEQVILPDENKTFLEKFKENESTKIPIVDFNPVQMYLKELRKNYSEFATFFHDTYGGNTIGVLWNPKVFTEKDFKVSYINGRKLLNGKLRVDLDALIEDFYILGKDLVKVIDIK